LGGRLSHRTNQKGDPALAGPPFYSHLDASSLDQQPEKNAVRKSKKSWLFTT
jgi:hypothetical protein